MELDDVDIKILETLLEDGRISFNDLAKATGVSTPTVSNRVATMTQVGLIRGFRLDLDTELLNEVTAIIILDCRPSDVDNLTQRMEALDEVRELYVVDGTRLMAKVTTLDNVHMNRFFSALTEIEEIATYRYHTVTRTAKELPRSLIHEGLKVIVECYYCSKPIVENPVKIKMDGKDHYLCCGSCESLYRDKYERIKEGSGLEATFAHVEEDVDGDSGPHDHQRHSHD
jgi:DNA-binding Lrp family transcriptional regulator